MRKLYFVRHGQSETNASGHIAGSTDTPLTKLGRKQAKKAGKAAKKLNIDLIVSSPLSRALETAQIIAKQIGYPLDQIHTNKLLMEQDYGSLEGQLWKPDFDLDGFSDIETEDSLVERAHLALKWIKSFQAEHVLVVSHGAIGRALRSVVNTDYTLHDHGGLANAEIVNWVE